MRASHAAPRPAWRAVVPVAAALVLSGAVLAGCAGGAAAGGAANGASGPAVTTFHGNNLRTGWDAVETVLTPQAVAGGLVVHWTSADLGGEVRGEPLYLPGVDIGGQKRNVVIVATEADTVWALDAQTGKPLWGPVSIGTPVPQSMLACGNINPEGITGTPVVDLQTNTVYVSGETLTPQGTPGFSADALDLATGQPVAGWPVSITPAGMNTRVQQQRSSLTLVSTPAGPALEVPFGGLYGDCGVYYGWVVQVSVQHPTQQAYWKTPSHWGGPFWAVGGLADTPQGLFGATGNTFNGHQGDMGDAVIRLQPGAGKLTQPQGPAGFFAPSNAVALDQADRDLGSGGVMALPNQPGKYPHLLVIAGKQGVAYLVNRDNPGGYGHGNGVTGEALWSACAYGSCSLRAEGVFSTAAYFQTSARAAYVVTTGQPSQPEPCTGTGGVIAWRLQTSPAPALHVAWCGPSMQNPGSAVVSSDGYGGSVVWVVETKESPALLALDGATGKLLWQTALPPTRRFATPTVAAGQVLVSSGSQVLAYGLK